MAISFLKLMASILDIKTAQFQRLVPRDLLIIEYWRKMKNMASALGDLGEVVQDHILVFNVLYDPNEKFPIC